MEKVLVSKNITFLEKKNFKYSIGCLYNGNEVKPLHIILPKTRAYIKGYDEQGKSIHFFA